MRRIITGLSLLAACFTANAAPGDAQLIAKAKETATRDFMDPDSAKFRKLSVVRGSVCGEVNSKNGFGGYVGYKRFVSVAGVVSLHDDGSSKFSEFHETSCAKNPPKPKAPPPYYEESWKDLEKDLSAPKDTGVQ
jgi:hypothetical protein